jgi:hypothetical protein
MRDSTRLHSRSELFQKSRMLNDLREEFLEGWVCVGAMFEEIPEVALSDRFSYPAELREAGEKVVF